MKAKIVILHNELVNNNPDEVDVIVQRDLVARACKNMNYDVVICTVGNDLQHDISLVGEEHPDLVFNLVESMCGKGELIYFAPALLNALKIPYTGVPLDALFITTNKVLAKKIMHYHDLPTADHFSIDELDKLDPAKTYIAKPIWEEASVGISEDYIFTTAETEKCAKIKQLSTRQYFVEEFIDGREFNVSILAGKEGAEVLPPAEMVFSEYFNNKPKIIGYKAKWDESSAEYQQTQRAFGTLENDGELNDKLIDICRRSWKAFNLQGYVRIDFRVDKKNNVYILEINGNPCIAPDSGFVAAIEHAGYSIETMIKRIIEDVN